MKRAFLFAALLAMFAVPPASADVPSTMSYQGVLTDGGGSIVPDGNYKLEFNIYDVSVAGVTLWTETYAAVPVTLGGFSVILGSSVPLNLPFDKQYWLGVRVDGNPELTPRVALASSPYGLSLRLPFAGSAASASPLIQLENTGGGEELALGSPTDDGTLNAYISGSGSPTFRMYNLGGEGTAIDMYGETGSLTSALEPDIDGDGGFFLVAGTNGGFTVDGNSGAGDPRVSISGAGSTTNFNTNVSGDASVSLPNEAVNATEILNEAGLSQGKLDGQLNLTSGDMQDIVTTTITIPADGYIFVTASGQHGMFTNSGSNNSTIQIDETAGGVSDPNHNYVSGTGGGTNLVGTLWNPVQLQRTYFKAAGTYTFRFEGNTSVSDGSSWLWNAVITAVYVPTGYGTVSESVTPLAVGNFSNVTYTTASGNGGGSASGQGAIVDLRELELRATQLKLQAREAELQLMQARRGQGQSAQLND